jgi:geranylgeranyl diphosphate synthase, type I
VTAGHPLTALYPEIRACLATQAEACGWPDFAEQIARHLTRARLPIHLLLPPASAAAVGGEARRAVPAAAACGFLIVAMRWFDDLADRDRTDSLWQEVGAGRATNLAAAALTVAWRTLAEGTAAPAAALRAFGELTVELARGQDADLAGGARTLDEYWRMMRSKTGAALALACRVGALAARPDAPEAADACGRFGAHLGTAMQILDDLDGTFHPDGRGDLAAGKVTLPVLYGLAADHPGRGELADLVAGGRLAAEAGRARALLDATDTRELLAWAALEEHRQGLACLAELPEPASDEARAGRDALEAFADALVADWEELLRRPQGAAAAPARAARPWTLAPPAVGGEERPPGYFEGPQRPGDSDPRSLSRSLSRPAGRGACEPIAGASGAWRRRRALQHDLDPAVLGLAVRRDGPRLAVALGFDTGRRNAAGHEGRTEDIAFARRVWQRPEPALSFFMTLAVRFFRVAFWSVSCRRREG